MRKKIAILLPDLRGGGAERVAVNLANEFIRRGYSVDMLLLSAAGEFLSELDQHVHVIDLKVSRLRWALFAIIRYLKKAEPDALLANMWPLTLISLIGRFLSQSKAKLVLVEHNTLSEAEIAKDIFVKWQMKNSIRLFYRFADAVVTVSKGALEDMCRFSGIESQLISVIHNPIVGSTQPSDDGTAASVMSEDKSTPNILAVGTFKKIKDFAMLIDAFALLRKSMDAKLILLGEGELRCQMEAQIERLGLVGQVLMPGFVKNPTPFYAQADLFVLSSVNEGFGNVIVEALNEGTPVVSTDCPSGPREILEEGKYGILTPVADAEAMAHAMLKSLNSLHNKEALKARAQDFTITKAADQYLALLFPGDADIDNRLRSMGVNK
jgi:glycosyltransferase involved in cell wall biosynthesis